MSLRMNSSGQPWRAQASRVARRSLLARPPGSRRRRPGRPGWACARRRSRGRSPRRPRSTSTHGLMETLRTLRDAGGSCRSCGPAARSSRSRPGRSAQNQRLRVVQLELLVHGRRDGGEHLGQAEGPEVLGARAARGRSRGRAARRCRRRCSGSGAGRRRAGPAPRAGRAGQVHRRSGGATRRCMNSGRSIRSRSAFSALRQLAMVSHGAKVGKRPCMRTCEQAVEEVVRLLLGLARWPASSRRDLRRRGSSPGPPPSRTGRGKRGRRRRCAGRGPRVCSITSMPKPVLRMALGTSHERLDHHVRRACASTGRGCGAAWSRARGRTRPRSCSVSSSSTSISCQQTWSIMTIGPHGLQAVERLPQRDGLLLHGQGGDLGNLRAEGAEGVSILLTDGHECGLHWVQYHPHPRPPLQVRRAGDRGREKGGPGWKTWERASAGRAGRGGSVMGRCWDEGRRRWIVSMAGPALLVALALVSGSARATPKFHVPAPRSSPK